MTLAAMQEMQQRQQDTPFIAGKIPKQDYNQAVAHSSMMMNGIPAQLDRVLDSNADLKKLLWHGPEMLPSAIGKIDEKESGMDSLQEWQARELVRLMHLKGREQAEAQHAYQMELDRRVIHALKPKSGYHQVKEAVGNHLQGFLEGAAWAQMERSTMSDADIVASFGTPETDMEETDEDVSSRVRSHGTFPVKAISDEVKPIPGDVDDYLDGVGEIDVDLQKLSFEQPAAAVMAPGSESDSEEE